MASVKQYGYYIEGNKIAIVQKDTSFDNDANSKDYGPGSDKAQWKSPLETVADALELQYGYAPKWYQDSNGSITNLTKLGKSTLPTSGISYLTITDNNYGSSTNFVTACSLAVNDHIVLRNAGIFNGLHKIKAINDYSAGTNNQLQTFTVPTKAMMDAGLAITPSDFEETPSLFYDIIALEDEAFELDLPIYLQKALIYYVRSKFFEDIGEAKQREYFYSLFIKQIERHNNSRTPGVRIIASSPNGIR